MTVNADREALLDVLACPVCRGVLVAGRSGLECSECGKAYTFAHEVPVMTEDQSSEGPSVLARLHYALLGNQRAYDLQQAVGGGRDIARNVQRKLHPERGQTLLDIGAGTGMAASLLPAHTTYIWCDNDKLKLRGFLSRGIDSMAVLGDAVRLPFRDGAADWTLMVDVSHHIPDGALDTCFSDIARVTSERFVFSDAVRSRRLRARILWQLDLGRYPRTEDELLAALDVDFTVDEIERFRINHDHIICVCTPRAAEPRDAAPSA